MKKWKTISITALTTLGLIAGGSFVYTSNQPAHYEGKTFKSSVSSSTTEESSLPEMDAYGTETASAEDNSYEGLYINNGPGPYNCIGDNAEPVSRYGFYIMTPMQRTNQIMVIQCGASREKEANIMEAEGHKQAAIAKAEGEKQSAILEAEANKQTQILQAQGHAESQRLIADAVKDQINSINAGLIDNGNLYLQYKNVEALEALAKGTANTVVLPSTAIDSLGSIPAVGTLFNQKKTADNN